MDDITAAQKIEEMLADHISEMMRKRYREEAELIAEWLRENVSIGNYWNSKGCRGKYADVYNLVEDAYYKARKNEKKEIIKLRWERWKYENEGLIPPPVFEGDLPEWESWQDVMSCHTWVDIVPPFGNPEEIQKDIEHRQETLSSADGRFNDPCRAGIATIADAAVMGGHSNRTYRTVWHDDAPEFVKELVVEVGYSDGDYRIFWLNVVKGGDNFITHFRDSSKDAISGANMGDTDKMHQCLQRFYQNLFDYVKGNRDGTYKTETCSW